MMKARRPRLRGAGVIEQMPAHAASAGELWHLFARGAAVAFALVALYTLVVKASRGEIERDWMHTALHIVTGAVAGYAGWMSADVGTPRLFTVTILIGYGLLGVVGWFIDGLFLHSSVRIPLNAADNVFHLLLAAAAATVIVRQRA